MNNVVATYICANNIDGLKKNSDSQSPTIFNLQINRKILILPSDFFTKTTITYNNNNNNNNNDNNNNNNNL